MWHKGYSGGTTEDSAPLRERNDKKTGAGEEQHVKQSPALWGLQKQSGEGGNKWQTEGPIKDTEYRKT